MADGDSQMLVWLLTGTSGQKHNNVEKCYFKLKGAEYKPLQYFIIPYKLLQLFSTPESPKLVRRGWIFMQIVVHRSRVVRKARPTLARPNSAVTKTQCSPVHLDFQNWSCGGM